MAKRSRNNSVVPLGLRVITVIYFFSSFLSVVFGVFSFIGAHFLKDVEILGSFAGSMAIFLLSIGVINFFIGFGLWGGFNWARILGIVSSCFGIILGFLLIIRQGSFLEGFLWAVVSLIVGLYLLLNPDVKFFFGVHKLLRAD